MKIGMQTWGSHGDIRPFLALAEGLRARGHIVTLLVTCVDSADYAGIASPHGVDIRVIASPVIDAEQAERIARTAYDTKNPMKQLATVLRLCYEPVEGALFSAAQQLCADADLLIGHYFLQALHVAAAAAGKPCVSVMLSHAGVPSRHAHPLGSFGPAVNRLLWWLTRAALGRTLNGYSNRLRRPLGLAPIRDVVGDAWITAPLTLLAVSPQLCRPQPDWPAPVAACGFLDTGAGALDGPPAPALSAFLDAGDAADAPVYMTFGSWMPKDVRGQTATLALLTDAARRSGRRAIIQAPAAAACGFASDARVLYLPAAPHRTVFPRCRAVVHHGGAGTTQAAALAGTPSVVISHISEQAHWARELQRLGIGAAPARRRSITAARLAQRIAALDSPAVQARAHAIGAAMRREDGVAAAVGLIEARFGAPA